MRFATLLAFVPLVLAAPTKREEPAPLLIPRDVDSLIPGAYIVKYKDDSKSGASALSLVGDLVNDVLKAAGVTPDFVYKGIFNGFSCSKITSKDLKRLRDDPRVEYVEQDAVVKASAFATQSNPPWGLARISRRKIGATSYTYDNSGGTGTCSYVLDTGIQANHPQFGGRAFQIKNFVSGDPNADGNGHGTHVAGIIGSQSYGVAKRTKLYGVKVLSDAGAGSISSIIAAMQFVTEDSPKRYCPKGVLVNMSLGGGFSAVLNKAAANLVKANVFVAVAAGNDNKDASGYSPASEPSVCTVGATTAADAIAPYSNYGSTVDIFAPGSSIQSTWIGSTTRVISGTSMATPHITGLAAYLATFEGFPGSVAMCNRIITLASKNLLTGLPSGTPNRLAFNNNPSGR